jgi:hypothetical protein
MKAALIEGLAWSLTVNEIKEILVQISAYAGFPRSLNGINTFTTLLDERRANGIIDEISKDAGAVPAGMNKSEDGEKVREYTNYFNQERPHQGISQPIRIHYDQTASSLNGNISSNKAFLGGVHHGYSRVVWPKQSISF